MADLDDFFAKKDRKKAKGKKFMTTEEIAKKLEETGKKIDKTKSKDKSSNLEGIDDNQQIEEDDEWKQFQEEKKDYTGLKIRHLTVTEGIDNDAEDDRATGENSSDGESSETGSKQSGPWKKADTTQAAPTVPITPSTTAESPQSSDNTTKSYKPPQMRNPQLIVDRPVSRIRGKNIAPDINSEEYFPTLNSKQSSLNDSPGVWGRKKRDEGNFEEVRNRGGSRTYSTLEVQSQDTKLSLGNKYGALPEDQS